MYRYEKKMLVDVLIKYMCSKTAFFLLCRTMMSIDNVHTQYPSRNILFLSLFLLPRRFELHPTLICVCTMTMIISPLYMRHPSRKKKKVREHYAGIFTRLLTIHLFSKFYFRLHISYITNLR
jgi:uncharacterized BrkB/YihY/UPF0761 family membrane protein